MYEMGRNYENLKKEHPCFGANGLKTGRIHLPVSGPCNICCRFCDRVLNDYEDRPGVASKVIKPKEAIDVLRKALKICPQITVAGIAGPGDTLASDYALETFRLIDREFPKLLKCMSTNGLLLPERAEEIIDAGIDTLTVTVNSVDPVTESKLNKYIVYDGKIIEGTEGARILIRNQLKGIEMVSERGITVKVNTVLVPGINDHEIEKTAIAVKDAGASMYNIIPLIPQYELSDCPAPGCDALNAARERAGDFIDVFRHCRHCRADAAGLLGGKDFGAQLYSGREPVKERFSHG